MRKQTFLLAPFLLCVFFLAESVFARPFVIESKPFDAFEQGDPARTQFGKLRFLGGLELSSPSEEHFGGLSGFSWIGPDRFLAITDRGRTIKGRLMLENGKPVGIDQAEIDRLPDFIKGKRRRKMDSEGLDSVGQDVWVSFEGSHAVVLYRFDPSGALRLMKRLPLANAIRGHNSRNKGFEALALGAEGSKHEGALVLISERVKDRLVQGWILPKRGIDRSYQAFTLPQIGDLRPTDAAFLANGDLVIVERSFSLLAGLKIQLRRIRAGQLKAGALSDVEILFSGDLRYELDNLEGLAVQALPDGSSLLTLVSDDNFSRLQRSLLLQFHLAD
ncbi:MAG: esterase-like activity of phytase family protein [Cohaesibacter sp.]|nr:esterase-like activity of phytase family protein [Cohaesibacter sp.]